MSRLNSPQSRHTPTPAFSPPPADFHRVRFATPQYITHSLASPVHGDVSDVGNLTPNELGDDEETGDGWNGQSNKVVLAITGTKGKVGCCAYDGPTGKLAFLEDQQDSSTTQGGWELVRLGEWRGRVELSHIDRPPLRQSLSKFDPTLSSLLLQRSSPFCRPSRLHSPHCRHLPRLPSRVHRQRVPRLSWSIAHRANSMQVKAVTLWLSSTSPTAVAPSCSRPLTLPTTANQSTAGLCATHTTLAAAKSAASKASRLAIVEGGQLS